MLFTAAKVSRFPMTGNILEAMFEGFWRFFDVNQQNRSLRKKEEYYVKQI
jgi:hypothetical protein